MQTSEQTLAVHGVIEVHDHETAISHPDLTCGDLDPDQTLVDAPVPLPPPFGMMESRRRRSDAA
jgi:hypothetical protein